MRARMMGSDHTGSYITKISRGVRRARTAAALNRLSGASCMPICATTCSCSGSSERRTPETRRKHKGLRNQETGVVSAEANGQATGGAAKPTNVTEELDNWDENMDDDWEEESADAAKVVAGAGAEDGDMKKRSD